MWRIMKIFGSIPNNSKCFHTPPVFNHVLKCAPYECSLCFCPSFHLLLLIKCLYCYLKKCLVLLYLIYKIRWALFRYYTVHCAANYPFWLWMCGRKYKSSYSKKRLFSCSLNYDLKSWSVSRSVVSNSLWPHGL